MNLQEIMIELEKLGSEQTRKTFINHGAPNSCYGVKIGDLKKFLLKRVKNNKKLCLELFATGNSDAQYLAGLGITPQEMIQIEIEEWLEQSSWVSIDEAIVSGVAAESSFALILANKWLVSNDERQQNVGWLTYVKYICLTPDRLISKEEIELLVGKIEKNIHTSPNLIRYSMNQFIIYLGQYYPDMTNLALETAYKIKHVEISLATKGCKLPDPKLKIEKMVNNGNLGKKRKKVIC